MERHFLKAVFHYESFTDLDDGAVVVFYLREAQLHEEEEKRRAIVRETYNHALAPDG